MRVGCLFFPHFPVQVEKRDRSALSGQPVIVGGYSHEPKPVHDASEEACRLGIHPGMPLRQAYVVCPQGVFIPVCEQKYRDASLEVMSLASHHNPAVEDATPYVFVDASYESDGSQFLTELVHLVREETGYHATAAVASSKFVARVGSQVASPDHVRTIRTGEERAFLQDLPVRLLPFSTDTLHSLDLLGLRRIGDIAELPPDAAELQFGGDGRTVCMLARGIDPSPLVPWQPPPSLSTELSFDPPATTLPPVLAGAEKKLEQLSRQLARDWRCCRRLTLSLSFTNDHLVQRTFHLKEATSSGQRMLRHITHCLEEARFTAPLTGMTVTLTDLCPEQGTQTSFLHAPLRSDRLASVVRTLHRRYGKGVVKRLLPGRPGALPEESFSLVDMECTEDG